MQKYDILWKAILEDIFEDFLRFFFPNADDIFDFSKGFEYLDKELEQLFPPDDEQFEPRYVDKLVKVFTKSGREEWILVHIEVQGYLDKEFSRRIYRYYSRIFDKYDRKITAFAIFTDYQAGFQPNKFEQEFLGTKLTFTYNTYKILDQPDDELLETDNPFAMVVLTAKIAIRARKITEKQLYDLKYNLARRLLVKKIAKGKVRVLMNFLKFYIRFENSETERKFDRDIELLTEKNTTMGIEEFLLDRAKKEGILEERKKKDLELAEERKKKDLELAEERKKKEIELAKKNREMAARNLETAINLKKAGVDVKIISEATGLTIEEIEKL
ncbi:MAG: Rpn family recombination-promoting nuclease/putative transposase [Cyclobacteriaceae bacterium]